MTLDIEQYLFKWVLVVPYHDLRPDQEQEADQTVHVTQSEVAQGTSPGVGNLANIELQLGLYKV